MTVGVLRQRLAEFHESDLVHVDGWLGWGATVQMMKNGMGQSFVLIEGSDSEPQFTSSAREEES